MANSADWYNNEMYPFRFSMIQPEDLDKNEVYTFHFNELLKDALRIVKIKNMPESFDYKFFMLTLILNGKICIFRDTKGTGELLALNMKTANRPNVYYVPKNVLVVNPTFKGYSYNLTPGEDCSVIYCTSMDQYRYGLLSGGLFGLISTTAALLADNTISINTAQKNTRLHKLIAADDDLTKKSIEEAMAKMYYGQPFQVVQKSLLDNLADIPMQPTDAQLMLQLIQANQYIKSQFFERIGFITHDQIKKERVISAELTEGAEMSIFNIMDMLETIKDGIQQTNELMKTEMIMEVNPLILRNIGITQEQFDAGDFMPAVPEDPESAQEPQEEPAAQPEEESADGEQDEAESAQEPQEEPAAEPEEEGAADLVEAAADLVEAAADPEPEAEQDPEEEEAAADGEPEEEPAAVDPLQLLEEAAARFRAERGNVN